MFVVAHSLLNVLIFRAYNCLTFSSNNSPETSSLYTYKRFGCSHTKVETLCEDHPEYIPCGLRTNLQELMC